MKKILTFMFGFLYIFIMIGMVKNGYISVRF